MTDDPNRGTSTLGDSFGDIRGQTADFREELAEATRQIRAMDSETQRLSRSLGSSLRSAFDKAVFGGGKLTDVFRGLARNVAGRALDSALRPVESAIGTGISSIFSGGLTGLFGFAKGGAFSAGNVRAFANGGIVNGPTAFPMRGGAGLMGEAGPEAIMPLTRGADGRLGVRAQGGGAPNVTINIQTPDVAGFERSRGQIAAQLARAVGRGSRRL
ncbi:MAG: phage tail tape measure protein [Pseudomonadota bacterium]